VSEATDFFLRGGNSAFPVFTPYNDIPDEHTFSNLYKQEGYTGDGDTIWLPTSSTGTFSYYNAADVLQWSKAFTDIDAACDLWAGFMYDQADDLVYCVAVDTGPSPDTYYLASIDSAGTIVNIGNHTPTVDYPSTRPEWGVSGSLQRIADGAGNFYLVSNAGEVEINFATGAFITDPYGINGYGFRTAKGNRIHGFQRTHTSSGTGGVPDPILGVILTLSSSHTSANVQLPLSSGVGGAGANISNVIPIQWKGYIALAEAGSTVSIAYGGEYFKALEFEKEVDLLATAMGIQK